MVNSLRIIIAVLFLPLILGGTSPKVNLLEDCITCDTKAKDSIIWERSTVYLDSLRGVATKLVVERKVKVDSLHKEVLYKDKIINRQAKKINQLKLDLAESRNKVVVDTLSAKERKGFWSKVKGVIVKDK